MTHARVHLYTTEILAIVLSIAFALATTTVPASARIFSFNSAGSIVQQPLPPQWACAMRRALSSSGSLRLQCRQPAGAVVAPVHGLEP
jgi:hypothetical protein